MTPPFPTTPLSIIKKADVTPLPVVVSGIRNQPGAPARIFGRILSRHVVMALVSGNPVALAIERAGGRRDQGQRIVEITFTGVGSVAVVRTLRIIGRRAEAEVEDRKSTRLNSSH